MNGLKYDGNISRNRDKIQKSFMEQGFTKTYDYVFVWENWRRD